MLGERSDVSELLNMSDIFVLTSEWEGLPLTILEAASKKLPIISTDVGGVNNFVKNNENGYLVNYNDTNEYSSIVIKLIKMFIPMLMFSE